MCMAWMIAARYLRILATWCSLGVPAGRSLILRRGNGTMAEALFTPDISFRTTTRPRNRISPCGRVSSTDSAFFRPAARCDSECVGGESFLSFVGGGLGRKAASQRSGADRGSVPSSKNRSRNWNGSKSQNWSENRSKSRNKRRGRKRNRNSVLAWR